MDLAEQTRPLRRRILRKLKPQAFKESYINQALATYTDPTYLEIGVRNGESFRCAKAARKIGIDPAPDPGLDGDYYEMTSDEFFAHPRLGEGSVHVALIDGLHEFRQAARDLLNLEPYMRPDGIVFFDDLNPATRERAGDPTGGPWNGDVWKIGALLARCPLELVTVDADQGVGMVHGFGMAVPDLDSEIAECKRLDYGVLERSRAEVLNLVAPAEFAGVLDDIRPLVARWH